MASNSSGDLSDSTKPAWSHPCPFMGDWAWKDEFLTPRNSKVLAAVISLEVIIALVTSLLNAMIIWAVWRKRYLRKQQSCVLLACLAATDLLVGAVALPLLVTGHAFRLSSTPGVCLVDTVANTGLPTASAASLLHLVVISGERYVAIKHALRYETLVTTRRLTKVVATAWAIPVLMTSAAVSSSTALAVAVHAFAVFVFLPGSLGLIGFYQIAVFLESRRHRQHIRAHQVSGAAAKEALKKDKAARTTTMVVGALLLCYASLPVYYGVTSAVLDSLPKSLAAMSGYVLDLIVCCNSLMNPVIYCLRTEDFKRAFRELFNLKTPPQATPRQEGVVAIEMAVRRQGNCEARVESSQGERSRETRPELKHSRTRSLDFSADTSRRRRTRRNNSI